MKRDQKGFAVVESMLLIIIVLLVGFIGYYVYHAKNNTNATYNNAANSSNNRQVEETNPAYEFKELNVSFKPTEDLKQMTYSKFDTSYILTTPEFKTLAEQCAP